jgi:hypothetical protein
MSKPKTWSDKEKKWVDSNLFQGQQEERSALVRRTAQNFEATLAANEQKRVADTIAANENALREALKASYTKANGGSDFGFEDVYPRLRAAHVEAETLANVAPKPATPAQMAAKTLKTQYSR